MERPSLTRGRAYNLQLLISLASAVFLGFEFLGTRDQILLSQIWYYINLEGQITVFISIWNSLSQLHPPKMDSC
jgi:hypothetical protein